MAVKKCPKCGRYSVSLDFHRGVEVCHYRACSWVNINKEPLPEAHDTVITSNKLYNSWVAKGERQSEATP